MVWSIRIIVFRSQFDHFEIFLARAAFRTGPVRRHVFPAGAGGDAFLRRTLGLVVDRVLASGGSIDDLVGDDERAGSSFVRSAIALVLLGALVGCGFHLRGATTLPFKTLWVSFTDTSPLGNEFKRNIRSATSTQLVTDQTQADASLEMIGEDRDKDILSLNSAGQVREYNLFYKFTFRVRDAKGKVLIPQTQIVLKRNISVDETNLLAKTAEEALLYRDMQSDLVQQLLRRLAAIKIE